jgi:hypothetical protein
MVNIEVQLKLRWRSKHDYSCTSSRILGRNYFVAYAETLLRLSFSVFRNPVMRDQEVMTGALKWPINLWQATDVTNLNRWSIYATKMRSSLNHEAGQYLRACVRVCICVCHNRTSGCKLPLSSVENRNCCKRRHGKETVDSRITYQWRFVCNR